MIGRAPCPWPISELLPHAPPMVLLDEVVDADEHTIVTAVTVGPSHAFHTKDGVPAHVGIELMAQACGAFVGLQALRHGEKVRIGYLLGTRDYSASRPWFRDGERLLVTATVVFREGEMGVFDCGIDIDGARVAAARLNVYQPPEDVPADAAAGSEHG